MGLMKKLDRFRWPRSERAERLIDAFITFAFAITAFSLLATAIVYLQ